MEAKQDRATAAEPAAELVIQNGRLKGTARPIFQPLTLIGRSADCDLRLNVDGIHALHCLLAQTADGLMLRDLSGDGSVSVNGKVMAISVLEEGDRLAVGPFQFQVRRNASTLAEQLATARGQHTQEKEALRIQAAAVAAQQAALLEEEERLQQRQTSLEQQETQLATHLEAKRKRLLELRDQIKEAHATLKDHKAKYGAQISEVKREVEAERREITDGKRRIADERRQLRALLKRMRQRFHRQWAAERESIASREAKVADERQEIEQERGRFKQEGEAMLQERLRLNADVELARRQLKEEWASLRQEELAHDETQSQQAAEAEHLRREIDQRESALAEVEQELEEQRNDWQEVRLELEREVDGLESRARNHRRKLSDLQEELTRLQGGMVGPAEAPPTAAAETPPALPPEVTAEPVEDASSGRLQQLERVAGELADQRAHLAEQWERLLFVQQRWQQHYQALVRELEGAARQLLEREQGIATRDRNRLVLEERMRQQQQESSHLQRRLEAWQARMTARETAWAGERDRLVTECQTGRQLTERRLAEIRNLHDRWTKRRRRELAWLAAERATCEKLRQECAGLRNDYLRGCADLQEEQRNLTERSLALEQYQQEVMGQSANPASAERRLHRIRIRWATHLVESQKVNQAERQKLDSEGSDLQERIGKYQKQIGRLTQREEELGEKLRKWEEDRLRVGDELDRLRQELEVTQAHRDRFESQVTELRDEVERIARLLIDEAPPILALPLQQEPPAQAA